MSGEVKGGSVHIKVILLGHLKPPNQQSALELDMQAGSTVSDVIHTLTTSLGMDFQRSVLDQRGKLHGGIEIVLNQEHLPARKIDSIQIFEDCELILMPMIEGGCISGSI